MAGQITPFVRDGERWLCPVGGLVAQVQGEELRIYQQSGAGVGHFPLTPHINGSITTLREWTVERGILTAKLAEHVSVEVRVWNADGHLHYHVYCPLPDPLDLTYFSGAIFRGPRWHTFVPDEFDQTWPKESPHAVIVSTAVDTTAEVAQGAPYRWMISPPPRACALQYDDGWLAIVVPRALPVGQTVFAVDHAEKFSLQFEGFHQGNAGNFGPEVVFMGGLDDPYQALDELAAISRQLHDTRGPVPASSWWLRPLFCTWGEQEQRGAIAGESDRTLTTEFVRDWVRILRDRLGYSDFNVQIDNRWFEAAGDFHARREGFGGDAGMRALIDELHNAGHRVLLWLNPFALDRGSRVVDVNEPDGLVCDTDGNPIGLAFAPLVRDFTFPPMREHFREVVRHLLGPAGLDADGLKIDGLYDCPDPRATRVHDASWGVGDELGAQVLAFIADTARAVKPDALISAAVAMPYLQSHVGVVRLSSNFSHSPLPWQRRARIVTRTLPGTLVNSGGWPLFRDNAAAHWITAPVYAIPALYHATMLDGRDMLTDADYRLLAVCWSVYANAPLWTDQRIVIDPENDLFERYYPDGSLAAMSSESTVLITAAPDEVRACALEERLIALPLATGQRVAEVQRVSIRGGVQPLDITDTGERPLYITVPDARDTGEYLRAVLAR